ncbi:hypothetical protein JCM10908_005707 [Rhodotorula pacifica]|uniref:uncharacterized protein n=1 Tax=Rhodotorula pacifica TaxID=1495444 RepID=UPI003175A666
MLGWSSQLGNKLFGPDPKLEFRKPGQGLDLLARGTIPEDSPYWRQYLTLFDSPTDLILLLPASQLTHTLRTNPVNLVSLIKFCIRSLVLFSRGDSPRGKGWEREVLNAVRVLARVVPVLLAPREGGGGAGEEDMDEFERVVFWTSGNGVAPSGDGASEGGGAAEQSRARNGAGEEGQFVLADEEDDEEDEPTGSSSRRNDTPTSSQTQTPLLAEQLLSALVDLLFVPGLTLPRSSYAAESDTAAAVMYSIWESGIASPPPPSSPSQAPSPPPPNLPLPILLARLEILRLLTLPISLPSLLTPPGLFPSVPNRWREAVVSGRVVGRTPDAPGGGGGDKKVVLCLLCSVLNTSLAAGAAAGTSTPTNPTTSATSGGFEGLRDRAARLAAETARRTTASALSAATGSTSLPGGGGAGGGYSEPTDEPTARLALVEACLQFLDVVLIEHAPDAETNQFAYYFARLHRAGDFELLAKGLVGFLVAALTTPTPSSTTASLLAGVLSSSSPATAPAPRCTTEAMTVLLRLIEANRKFVPSLAAQNPALLVQLLVALQACMVNWAQEGEPKLGMVRLASFAMQTFCAQVGALGREDGLSRALNAPLEPRVVGIALAAVVKRQMATQGIETESERLPSGDLKVEQRIVTFSEYLVISLHALVLPQNLASSTPTSAASYRAALSTLYPSLLLAMTNLSPLMRELGNEAATRLVRVWLAFSAPSWVLMEEGNPRLVFYLLEAFNNIAQFNLDRNPHLLYALAVSLPRFDLFANFTLSLGIAEARRLRAARRERLRPISEGAEDSASRTSQDGPSEKALGKRRASSVSLGGLSLTDSRAEPGAPSPALSRSESSASLGGASLGGSAEAPDRANSGENRPFVGRNGFIPTESWVASWREGLPLDTLLVLLSDLRRRLIELDSSFPASKPSDDVITSLRKNLASAEVRAILPAKPDTLPRTRKFQPSTSSNTWLASTIYGRLYLSQIEYLRDSLPVQLFAVAHAPKHVPRLGQLGAEMERVGRSAAQVGGRVGGVLSGVLGRLS